jgi:outer membrane protein assembly factor BamB
VMFGRAASPLIVDSLVIVSGGGPKGKAKNLVAFDRETGQLVWEAENKLPNGTADQIAYASPSFRTLAGRRQLLIVNESTVSGHDPTTGKSLWSHPWPGKSNGDASVSQAVPIEPNRVLLSKGYSGGAELIELSAGAGDELTVTSVWKNSRVLQTKFSNVVLYDGHAFALSEGIFECATLESGRRIWKKGRYGHGQILGVGNLLLVMSEEGELHLLQLNPRKLVELGSIPALSGKTWNTLCLYGKRLLVRNAEEAACFELP